MFADQKVTENMSGRSLVVVATAMEIGPLLSHCNVRLSDKPGSFASFMNFDFLVTGIGQMASAFHLGSVINAHNFTNIINLGIGGSFDSAYPIKSVVVVEQDALADLGLEHQQGFSDLFDMKLIQENSFPFTARKLKADAYQPLSQKLASLPRVHAVTVNRVLQKSESIDWIVSKYSPQIVSMEGASVFYACLHKGLPCTQVRAISDMVGTNNRSNWDIQGAIESLNQIAISSIFTL